ncbi:MAG: acyltransferase [Pseudomonadota bacterium]|nr:acyltransferase [Pseudomonadota bacterium]
MSTDEHWRSRPEGGSAFSLWLIRTIALRGGRRLARLCLYPITLYFYLRRAPERLASRQYLQRVFGRPTTRRQVFHHLHTYAASCLDRVFLLAHGEQAFDIEIEGLDVLEHNVSLGRGLLMLGSHHGSFEALRAVGSRRPSIPVRVVLDKQKTPTMTQLLEELAPEVGALVIDASQDGTSIALAMAEACSSGQVVAMLADRGREREMFRSAPLLGSPAPFPVSPWLLAHSLQVPVVLCFGIYLGGNRYRLIFEPFSDRIEIPRQNRGPALNAVISRYAQRLEHYVRLAPYNWFNFYDFWQTSGNPVAPEAAVGERVGA